MGGGGGTSMPGREKTAVVMVTDEDASLTLQDAPEYFPYVGVCLCVCDYWICPKIALS